ncbi:hypothetical protein D3C75_1160670 [compost metagenome]
MAPLASVPIFQLKVEVSALKLALPMLTDVIRKESTLSGRNKTVANTEEAALEPVFETVNLPFKLAMLPEGMTDGGFTRD